MDRIDLKALRAVRDCPAVSIFVRTYRTAPDSLGDALRVKDAVKAAIERLTSEFSPREVASITVDLLAATDEVDYQHTLDTLAIFASSRSTATIYLPYEVPEGSSSTRRSLSVISSAR